MNATKQQMLDSWSAVTGDPVRETLHLARLLSEAGLLPERQRTLIPAHVVNWLIARLASALHKDAAETVRTTGRYRALHTKTTEAWATELMSLDLHSVLCAALRPPFAILEARAALTGGSVVLNIARRVTEVHTAWLGVDGMAEILFGDGSPHPHLDTSPVEVWRTIDWRVTLKLSELFWPRKDAVSLAGETASQSLHHGTHADHDEGALASARSVPRMPVPPQPPHGASQWPTKLTMCD